jgi:hypothetical protein
VACLTYAIVLYTYVLRPWTYKEGARNRLDTEIGSEIQQYLRKKKIGPKERSKADNALFTILLALSDQQLVTGFAILTVAYIQMDSISTYHVAIIECMAGLAFVVYESAATITIGYLKDAERARFKLAWRGGFILCFMVLLLVTQIPFGNQHWLYVYGLPYKCFWHNTSGNYYSSGNVVNLASMLVNMVWIFWGILRILNNYFPRGFDWLFPNLVCTCLGNLLVRLMLLPRWLTLYSQGRWKDTETTNKVIRSAFGILWIIFYLPAVFVFIMTEMVGSEAFSLQGSWFIILNSIFRSFDLRSMAPAEGRVGDESKWGFGQAVPVFLLVVPFLILLETIVGTNELSPLISCGVASMC